MHFIYALSKECRDMLLKRGCTLLKEDEKNSLWIFARDGEMLFEREENNPCMVFSDTMSF